MVYRGNREAPGVRRVGFRLLKFHELGKVGLAQWVGFTEVAVQVELIEPDLTRTLALVEKEDHGFHARAGEHAAGKVEDGVEITGFEEEFAQGDGGIVGVREEGIFDYDARPAARLEDLDEVLEKEESGFAGFNGEVLLDFRAFLTAEGRVREDDVVAVLFLDVHDIFGEGVRVDDVRRLYPVEDHIHGPDDIGEGFLFLAVEGPFLEGFNVLGTEFFRRAEVVEGLAEEARGTDGSVVDAVSDGWGNYLDDGANEGTRGVVLTAVPACVAHVLNLALVEVAHFVLFGASLELELVHKVDDFPEVITGLELVLELAEDLPDLVFDGVRAFGVLLELLEIWIELVIHELLEIVAGHGGKVVELPVFFRGRPG